MFQFLIGIINLTNPSETSKEFGGFQFLIGIINPRTPIDVSREQHLGFNSS